MKYSYIFVILISAICNSAVNASTTESDATGKVLIEGNLIAFVSGSMTDPKFIGGEFGVIHQKKVLDRSIYPYVAAFLYHKKVAQEEFPESNDNNLFGGAMGAKAGILVPTSTQYGFSLMLLLGGAKTAVQKNPWFGRVENNVDEGTLYLVEPGLLYHYKHFIFRLSYMVTSMKYIRSTGNISIGVNF